MTGLFRFGLALVIGAFGGAAFNFAGLPLPWLLGALTATLAASLLGAPIQVSKGIRNYIAVVIGLMVGSSFSPEVLARAPEWIPTLTAAVAYIFIITAVAQIYCRKVLGMDNVTALFSGLPGGLSEMTILGEEAGADIKKLILTHACRVATVLLAMPMFLTFAFDMHAISRPAPMAAWGLQDFIIMVVCGVLGVPLARILRIPASLLVGPIVLSAVVHLNGWITTDPPQILSIAIQLILGSALGSRFYGTSLKDVGAIMVLAVGMTLVMLLVTLGGAYLLSVMTGLSFAALILALAPGGFAEMALAALSMGIDPAFVTTHHALRLFVIVFVTPVLIKYVFLRKRTSA